MKLFDCYINSFEHFVQYLKLHYVTAKLNKKQNDIIIDFGLSFYIIAYNDKRRFGSIANNMCENIGMTHGLLYGATFWLTKSLDVLYNHCQYLVIIS
jgi:hypothetical protein